MRHRLPILAVALTAIPAAAAQAQDDGRRPRARVLPPEIVYRDARPRFQAPPVAAYAVRAYVPRPTYQPMFNEPPQPLR